jgi:uncharacterized protein YprB with RNaseH-like and TPR domain
MIRNTFSILNGIGEKLERKLWRGRILTWDDFIGSSDINCISPHKKVVFDESLSSARNALDHTDAGYFACTIKRREHWRLFDIFKEESACLDIETNGLMPGSGGVVTVIGIYDGSEYKCFVRHENLTAENIMEEISRYKYLITFYGAGFDIPYLLRSMPDLKFDIPHFDICFGTRRLGFQGGLKKLELELGIARDKTVKDMNGYDAVKLWEYAQRGSSDSLELLKLYNKEDTVNLFTIAEIVYQRLRLQTGIEEYL